MTRVLIGIQARSTSQRLPGKALMNLYNKPVLSWVINVCMDSANFITTKTRDNLQVDVAILTPVGDEISRHYKSLNVVEGDEEDVLSRYVEASRIYNADYIVRITGDCPFLTSFMITNHVFKCINNGLDYLTNADPMCRTELDGRDIEVMSIQTLMWLDEVSTKPSDREHCTPQIRALKPCHLRRGHLLNRLDFSDVKLSVDTDKDLDRCERRMASFFKKRMIAENDVGKHNVFYS